LPVLYSSTREEGEYLGIWGSRQSSINKSPNLPDSDWPEQNS
jgi:hypothetical protein